MKKTYLKFIVIIHLFLIHSNDIYAIIGNDRTIFVELFGTNIYYVDENSNGTFEREKDLINYCTARNYKILILNIAPVNSAAYSILEPTFSRKIININTVNSTLENHLGDFIKAAHDAGISKIAAHGSGHRGSSNVSDHFRGSQFFRNVNEFNRRMIVAHGTTLGPQYCFDIVYTELDFWNDEPIVGTKYTNYKTFYRPGLDNMLLEKERSKGTIVVGSGINRASGTLDVANNTGTTINPFFSLNSNSHNQHLIKANELTEAGLQAGDVINSMGFQITDIDELPFPSPGMKDFSLKIGPTTATDLNNFAAITNLTTVFTSSSYSPISGINFLNFTNNFTWNGTSNILIEICYGDVNSNGVIHSGIVTDPTTTYISTIHTNSTTATAGSAQCSITNSNVEKFSERPVFLFTRVNTTTNRYKPIETATYLGDLSQDVLTPQIFADQIDLRIDLVYVAQYFIGWQVNSASAFFNRDDSKGRRLLTFANNNNPTKLIPLFSVEASDVSSENNWFGDYIKNDNGYHFGTHGGWNGTLADLKTTYDSYYTTTVDPYSDGSTRTLQYLTETDPTLTHPNDMSEGIGVFKYGCAPDSRLYFRLPSDNNEIHTLPEDKIIATNSPFTIPYDQIVIPGTHLNNVASGNGFSPSINSAAGNFRWYKDGVFQASIITSNPSVSVQSGITNIWTVEAEVITPGNTGYFNNLKFRADIEIMGNVPTAIISATTTSICPGEFVSFNCTTNITSPVPTFEWYVNSTLAGSNSASLNINTLQNGDVVKVIMTSNELGTPVTTISNTITITVHPTINVSIQGLNQTYCQTPSTVQLNSSPSSGTVFYIDNNQIVGSSFDPSNLILGFHDIAAIHTDAFGCSFESQTYQIEIVPVPNISVTSPVHVCVNETDFNLGANLNPNPPNGVFSGAHVSFSSPNYFFDANAAGQSTSNTVIYTVTQGTCSNSTSTTLLVDPQVNRTISISASDLVVTSGDPTDIYVDINPMPNPNCTATVQLWWRHDPQGSPVEYPVTNFSCPSCTLSIVPSNIEDPSHTVQFTSNDEFFVVYIPCDCGSSIVSTGATGTITVQLNVPTCQYPTGIGISDLTNATCPSYSNGSVTVSSSYNGGSFKLYHLGENTVLDSSTSNPATFNNLTAGLYEVRKFNNFGNQLTDVIQCSDNSNPLDGQTYDVIKYFWIPASNILQPQIMSSNNSINCSNTFSVINPSQFSTFQWYLNGTIISSATSSSYTATQFGNYFVRVTSGDFCGESNLLTYNYGINSTITGSNSNCGSTVYSVPSNTNNATYTWTIPSGASYTQAANSITVNWGVAYKTGGVISCTVRDACGNSSTGTITVTSCCNISLSVSSKNTCNGSTNNGSISITTSSGNSPYSFSWSPNVGNASFINNLGVGNYIITVTDSKGCSKSTNTIAIESSTKIKPEVLSNYPCSGTQNGILVASASGGSIPYQYAWNTGQTSSTLNNLAANNYTVTISDNKGCSATKTISLLAIPTNLSAPIINGAKSTCANYANSDYYTITNFNDVYSQYYSWSVYPTNAAVISFPYNNKKIAKVQWQSNEGGRIDVSVGRIGCQTVTSTFVQGCCSSTYTYYDKSDQSNITNSEIVTRSTMTFNGDFFITESFTFKDCGTISFASGSKIIVKNGQTLTIDNCKLGPGSCCKMWKGIILEQGAKIVIKNNSTIEQAECALTVNNGCLFDITNSHFINNYIGIKIGTGSPTTITGSKLMSTEFKSSNYSCSGTAYNCFVSKYVGQETNLANVPYAGIIATNVTYFKFGSTTGLVTGGDVQFNNLLNGLIINNSNVVVRNTTFKNMENGCGIDINGGDLNIDGMGGSYQNSENTFENCLYAINAVNGILAVAAIKSSDDVIHGIYYQDCSDVKITSSSISAKLYGIHGYHNPNADVVIENNDIHMSGTPVGYACIRLDEFNLGHPLSVVNNSLYLNYSRYGILTYSMHNAIVSDNYIQMNNVYNTAGISNYFSQGCTFQCNTIQALQFYPSAQSGIVFSLSPENWATCNWMNKQNNGIRVNGACQPLELEGNIFNDHTYGLYLSYNALIGEQTNNGNKWDGSYSSYGAYLTGINSASALSNQITYYDPSNSNPPTSNNDILNFGWFVGNEDNDFECSSYGCQPVVPSGTDPRFEDEIIALDDKIGTEYVDPSNYFADRFLFERLQQNPQLLIDNPILQVFYDQKILGTIGDFSEVNQEISEAVKWESVYDQMFHMNLNIIESAMDSLEIIDSLLFNGYLGGSSVNGLNYKIEAALQNNDAILPIIEQIQTYRIENTIDENRDIPLNEEYEYNEYFVNDIYLNTVASGEYQFTDEQKEELLLIAEQCPYSGGPAVYNARSLYHLVDPTADWDDDALCLYYGIQPRLKNPNQNLNQTLFPNPTTGKITVGYQLNEDEKGVFEVYSTFGQVLFRVNLKIDQENQVLDLSTLNPALYYYRIVINDEVTNQGTLSIIK